MSPLTASPIALKESIARRRTALGLENAVIAAHEALLRTDLDDDLRLQTERILDDAYDRRQEIADALCLEEEWAV